VPASRANGEHRAGRHVRTGARARGRIPIDQSRERAQRIRASASPAFRALTTSQGDRFFARSHMLGAPGRRGSTPLYSESTCAHGAPGGERVDREPAVNATAPAPIACSLRRRRLRRERPVRRRGPRRPSKPIDRAHAGHDEHAWAREFPLWVEGDHAERPLGSLRESLKPFETEELLPDTLRTPRARRPQSPAGRILQVSAPALLPWAPAQARPPAVDSAAQPAVSGRRRAGGGSESVTGSSLACRETLASFPVWQGQRLSRWGTQARAAGRTLRPPGNLQGCYAYIRAAYGRLPAGRPAGYLDHRDIDRDPGSLLATVPGRPYAISLEIGDCLLVLWRANSIYM
jgi:hypothetical protein